MPLQATSGAASYDAFGGGVAAVPNYIEDVFSTWLYTGNGSTQTINNGIDLAGKGGLVWGKNRAASWDYYLADTAQGVGKFLSSNTTSATQLDSTSVTAFNANGFSIGNAGAFINNNGVNYVSWTFREQPKFFDVVTWTGDDNVRSIPHNLGSTPGCVIIKPYSGDLGGGSTNWYVWHRSVASTQGIFLNRTDRARDWDSGSPIISVDATHINILANNGVISATGQVAYVNTSRAGGQQYIAYIFAHNAGGFGLSGTDNVISCGSFSAPSGNATVTLGYEPQYILWKRTDAAQNWNVYDTMRGWAQAQQAQLYPNLTQAEDMYTGSPYFFPTATGFQLNSSFGLVGDYIYIAIRRGPMRTPTTGTSVFNAITRTGTGAAATITGIGFAPDLVYPMCRNDIANKGGWVDKLRGASANLTTSSTDAESINTQGVTAFGNTSISVGTSSFFNSALNYVNYFFVRAPGFMDVVCYSGTGVTRTVTHNLGVAPELIFLKVRNNGDDWYVRSSAFPVTGSTGYGILNATSAIISDEFSYAPTATTFTVGTNINQNGSGFNYVASLFASCPGVSKVGSYSGTSGTQTISCGFAARFVLIKRTNSTGNWWVWDTARGMVSGTDPRLALNSTAAETNADWVLTNASGFQIVTSDATVNASGSSYIYLAIA